MRGVDKVLSGRLAIPVVEGKTGEKAEVWAQERSGSLEVVEAIEHMADMAARIAVA